MLYSHMQASCQGMRSCAFYSCDIYMHVFHILSFHLDYMDVCYKMYFFLYFY